MIPFDLEPEFDQCLCFQDFIATLGKLLAISDSILFKVRKGMSHESSHFRCFEHIGAEQDMHETYKFVLGDALFFEVITDQNQPKLGQC